MSEVEPGQWVRVDCRNAMGLAFEHDGIVADVPQNASSAEDITVIHFAWTESVAKRTIVEVSLATFMRQGDHARIVSDVPSFDADRIAAHARSQLGRADHHLMGRNCQHFAHWCRHGSAFSQEVRRYSVLGASFGIAVLLAGLLGMHCARGGMWR